MVGQRRTINAATAVTTASASAAIQVGSSDPSVVAIKLPEVPRIVVAVPSVIGVKGVPQHASDLAHLPWLALRTFCHTETMLIHRETGLIHRLALHRVMGTDSLCALRMAFLICSASRENSVNTPYRPTAGRPRCRST